MKAMILAAGMGTRLMPLTSSIPKALVMLNGKTLLETAIVKLRSAGFDQIIVNVHHKAGQVLSYLREHDFTGTEIAISDEQDELLDTGGGIMKARWFLEGNEPFLVHNVDVVSGIDLNDLFKSHGVNKNLVTLAVTDRPSSRYLLFDGNGYLCGWQNKITGEEIIARETQTYAALAFSGIHVIDPAIFTILKKAGRFPVMELYLELAGSYRIRAYQHSPASFFDLGTPEKLKEAELFFQRQGRDLQA